MLRTEACLDCIHEYFKHTWRQVRPLSRSCVLLSMRIERGLKPMKMEQTNQLNQLASDSFAQDSRTPKASTWNVHKQCHGVRPPRKTFFVWEAVSHVLSWVELPGTT